MVNQNRIPIKNIYYMLAYAFQALRQNQYEKIETEKFENIHNLLAAILVRAVGQQIKRGLFKEYRLCRDELHVLRGKIDIPRTIHKRLRNKHEVSCEFDELTENNLLNQILKTTLHVLMKHGNVNLNYKAGIKRCMVFFSNVDFAEISMIPWNQIRYQKNNSSYQLIIGICQLILQSLLYTAEKGEHKLASFLDDTAMCRLYEKFLLKYFIYHHRSIKTASSHIQWFLDSGSDDMLPIMKTDILMEKNNKILIIDAKYYSNIFQSDYNSNKTLHSNNLYQIFTYVKNTSYMYENNEKKVSGMILYAMTVDQTYPNNHYHMHGNDIAVKTLDLSVNFSEVRHQLDSIVNDYFGCAQI